MKKLLLDENLDRRLKVHFSDEFEVAAVPDLGWQSKKNGELLTAMVEAGFDCLLTADKNLRFQQNLNKYNIVVVVLLAHDIRIAALTPRIAEIKASLTAAPETGYVEVDLARMTVGGPALLEHNLNSYFPKLLKFESTPEMEASAIYPEIREDVERILNAVVVEQFAVPPEGGTQNPIRALAWNLERGIQFEGIVGSLTNNPDLGNKDILMLPELDHGMARSGNRFVAKELAKGLGLNYAFAPVYIALQKGSGVEVEMEGENTTSIHGLAMMSRWPVTNVHAIPLPNGKDKMWGKEKRIGYLRGLIADIEHPTGTFRAVTLHLDAHCSRHHRFVQMKIVLDHLETLPPMPTLIGGDWNTTTFNAQNARRAILGYWRRVMMGVKNVVKNHYPHPDRYFERQLFGEVERRGYEYKSLNEIGAGTIHYDVASIEKNTNLRDWVPEWCFPFIFWAANRVGGRVSGRLDWFAGKGIEVAPGTSPKTIGDLTTNDGTPLSDHDAITLEIQLATNKHE